MRSVAKRQTAAASSSDRPTGRQMRVWACAYFDRGADTTPRSTSASISTWGSPPGSLRPGIGPTWSAEWDQVDWVRYLIAEEMRELPSTSSTSAGRRSAASAIGSSVVVMGM